VVVGDNQQNVGARAGGRRAHTRDKPCGQDYDRAEDGAESGFHLDVFAVAAGDEAHSDSTLTEEPRFRQLRSIPPVNPPTRAARVPCRCPGASNSLALNLNLAGEVRRSGAAFDDDGAQRSVRPANAANPIRMPKKTTALQRRRTPRGRAGWECLGTPPGPEKLPRRYWSALAGAGGGGGSAAAGWAGSAEAG